MEITDVILYKALNQFKVYGCKMNINFRQILIITGTIFFY